MSSMIFGLLVLTSTAGTISTSSTSVESSPALPTAGVREAPASPSPTLSFDRRVEDAGAAWGVYTRVSSQVPRAESGFATVSGLGALVRFEAGAEYAPWSPVQGVSFEAGLSTGLQTRRILETADAKLAVTSLQVSAVYRRPVWSYFGAYARATGGLDIGHLAVSERVGDFEIDDVAVAYSAAGALGAELLVPVGYTQSGSLERADQWLSFHFEVGYALASAFRFDEMQRDLPSDSDPARIATSTIDAGSLRLDGFLWRMGAAFRF